MAEKEYIEREAAIESVTVWYRKACRPENMSSYNMGERAAYTTAISVITELPAADVRPVVLCKDCLHEDCAMYHGPNWFCANGEKREES